MGERGTSVSENGPYFGETAAASELDLPRHEPDPPQIEREIAAVRSELGDLVDELDRRRHEALDLRLQAQRHPLAVAFISAFGVLAVGGIAFWIYRRTRPEPALTHARKLAHALAVVSKHPDKLVYAMERRPDPRASMMSALMKVAGTAGQRAVRHAI